PWCWWASAPREKATGKVRTMGQERPLACPKSHPFFFNVRWLGGSVEFRPSKNDDLTECRAASTGVEVTSRSHRTSWVEPGASCAVGRDARLDHVEVSQGEMVTPTPLL